MPYAEITTSGKIISMIFGVVFLALFFFMIRYLAKDDERNDKKLVGESRPSQ